MNPFAITSTYDLVRMVEKIKTPASYVLDKFFPQKEMTMSDYLPVETLTEGRRLAPFVSKGAKGLNVERTCSQVRAYKPALIGARRTISLDDIQVRQFGETPIFSTKTAADRAADVQGRDLSDLLRMLANRRNAMASELMTTGKITVKAYADDGKIAEDSVIDYKKTMGTTKDWTSASANIFDDLREASETIQEAVGTIPTLMICGANVEKYMLANKDFREWLFSANGNAMHFINYTPQYSAPQVRNLGYIGALNLEMYSYLETYKDSDGQIKPFIPANTVIIGVPGRGRQIYGAVSYLPHGSTEFETALAENVPVYNADSNNQQTSLTVYSRFLPIMEDLGDWQCFKVATTNNLQGGKAAKGLPTM